MHPEVSVLTQTSVVTINGPRKSSSGAHNGIVHFEQQPDDGRAISRRSLLTAAAWGALTMVAVNPSQARAEPLRLATPRPVRALVSRWDTNPWARGSYSAIPVGTDASVRETLATTLLAGRVTLAGEYCDPDHPATTTGAYSSGVRAARRLLASSPRTALVIGAGLAGAAAAHTLAAAGVNVTVVEASGRVGGRILTDRTWGRPVEMGAAWIHDWQNNPVTTLARQAKLPLRATNYDSVTTRDTVTGRSSSAAVRADDRLSSLIDSIGDATPSRNLSAARWMRNEGFALDRVGRWAAEVELTQEYGLDASHLGQQAQTEGSSIASGDVMVGDGYSAIVSRLLRGIVVRRHTPISSVTAHSGSVDVRTSDGHVMRADVVVVAVPLSLLQRRMPAVSPWPATVSRAAAALTTGNLEKVVLQYRTRWWGTRDVLHVVGGGVPGAPAGSAAALRWTEFYDLTNLLKVPSLVAFSGGSAARLRPRSDVACVAEVTAMLDSAFRG